MSSGIPSLLSSRQLLPLFIAQFFGVVNDNLFKNAMVILVIFRLGDQSGLNPQILVTASAGLFILPYFLFSATTSQLADRYEKSAVMRATKLAEMIIAALAAWSLSASSVIGMMSVLFLLGAHSTIFGLLKYSVLPEYLHEDDLIDGNALIEGGTFLAILIGTIAGGVLILTEDGVLIVSGLMLALACGGFAASLFLPKAHAGDPAIRITANFVAATHDILAMTRRHRELFLAVLGISWFWLIGATYLSQFPALAKNVLAVDEHGVTAMLTVFSIGIGGGSVLCGRLLKGVVSPKYVPFAALGMALFAFDFWLSVTPEAEPPQTLATLTSFLSHLSNWRILADLLGLSICGGLYIVPLYALLQVRSTDAERARVIASNNIMNAAFMVMSALVTSLLLTLGVSVPQVFLVVAIATLVVAFFARTALKIG